MARQLIDITDRQGAVQDMASLKLAERVHRQLRPHLPTDYVATLQRVFAGGGRMVVAVENAVVQGVAVWRSYENTVHGPFLYIDDLVTDDNSRSRGVGNALMEHCRNIARELGCNVMSLDSGTQRQQAHKFYFREQMLITSFHFAQQLK